MSGIVDWLGETTRTKNWRSLAWDVSPNSRLNLLPSLEAVRLLCLQDHFGQCCDYSPGIAVHLPVDGRHICNVGSSREKIGVVGMR